MSRISLSKAVRFEVFKRDNFTCQYCGRKAPDVILECDHIVAVAAGGANDPLNLATACHDCNNGKRDRALNETVILDKQRAMLEQLNERREQLEMLIRWRDELQDLKNDTLSIVVERLNSKYDGVGPSDSAVATLKKIIKKYPLEIVLEAVDEAFDLYFTPTKSEDDTLAAWSSAFNKINSFAGIAAQSKEKPYIGRILYIQGIIRKRIRARHFSIVDYLEHLYLHGADLEQMEARAKTMRSRDDFEGPYDSWLESIGEPF